MQVHKEFWFDCGDTNTKPWRQHGFVNDRQDKEEYWNDDDVVLVDTVRSTVEQALQDPYHSWHHINAEDELRSYIEFFNEYKLYNDITFMEIGCGSGRNLLPFLISNEYDIIGIDHSQKAVDVCRARMPDFEFHCQSATDLSIFYNKIDVIMTLTALQHNSGWKLTEIFPEIYRSLKSNGVLWLRNEMTIGTGQYANTFPNVLPLKPYTTDQRSSHGTAAWWIGFICDNGFELLKYENSEYIFRRI